MGVMIPIQAATNHTEAIISTGILTKIMNKHGDSTSQYPITGIKLYAMKIFSSTNGTEPTCLHGFFVNHYILDLYEI